MEYRKSNKFEGVGYDIRGPLLKEAQRLEASGHKILKLNIGNTKPFGFDAPDEIRHDVAQNLVDAEGYADSKGIFPARKAIMQVCQTKGFTNLDIDNVILTNGVSEGIRKVCDALLNRGDEILLPSPDYPLWTAAVKFAGGKPVHYLCDEQSGWLPDIGDLCEKITAKTKGIVIIPFNNPTGAVYPRDILKRIVQEAQERKLIIFSDEIYDKILYDGAEAVSIASLADDVLFVTFNGLSKAYRLPGYRAGWVVLSGDVSSAKDFKEGLSMLSDMSLGCNVPGQLAIQTALGGYQSIYDLTKKGGRLYEQREIGYQMLTKIEGITCVKPLSALYFFPKIDVAKFDIKSDEKFLLDFLREKHVLLVPGKGFNWKQPDHFRIVFLPHSDDMIDALTRLADFLSTYRQK
ncbi:MAG: pyridoxal phosphate-dependent aminotransferase [Candidatus Parcubacteria bacterium]|nr:pyridoxal phosphate-dependent aminotransferase [Candidatus Parcubacteria bacterium]